MQDFTLSDGIHLPRGTRFSMASAHISNDPAFTTNPEFFDGFRYSNERQSSGQSFPHQFASTDKRNLHFGHGKYGCPGRFFASQEIKMILAHLLLRYEIKFAENCSRPKNMTAFEYIFPDPTGVILFKQRTDSKISTEQANEE